MNRFKMINKSFSGKYYFCFILFVLYSLPGLFSQTATIDVSWNTFNRNQYDGALLLPSETDGSVEFVGGFGKSSSKDGSVVTGSTNSSGLTGIGSLNSMHWEIKQFKSGIYRFYLFCTTGGSQSRDDWSNDVRIKISIDGVETIVTPQRKNGAVWEVLFINGATREIVEKQMFYPVRHMVFGRVMDAVTGFPLEGVTVAMTDEAGRKTIDGQLIQTDVDGFYFLHGFPMGRYNVIFSADKYITASQSTDFMIHDLPREINFMMSPILKDTQFRIVLDWGASPADLDVHLNGPGRNLDESFHISYSNIHIFDSRHTLDIDDKNSYGPETITITGLDSGTYTYSIHNFTDRRQTNNSWNLALSGAKVSVFQGSHLISQYTVPEQEGTVWRVFSINGDTGRVTEINRMLYESDSEKVY